MTTPKIQPIIESKLKQSLNPLYLQIENESYKHSVPPGSETHFKVVVVSEQFNGKNLITQHRLVNEILKEELSGGVHALALKTITPDKWTENSVQLNTPNCLGGSKHDK